TALRLPLGAGGVVEVICFHRAFELAMHLIGQCSIAEPPAPPIARPDMHAHLPRNAPRRAGETEQKSGQNPVHHRTVAAIQECAREVIEGALAALLFAATLFLDSRVLCSHLARESPLIFKAIEKEGL